MTERDVIKEEGDLRVSLINDEYPEEPYDDGQSPMIRIDRNQAGHVQVGSMRPTASDNRIEEAVTHFWTLPGRYKLVEKYLRAYHGATTVKWYGPNQSTDYTYVTYDTPEWAECIGYDDNSAPRADYDGSKAVNMNEYISYLEGDVYGYVVERMVHVKVTREVTADDISRTEETEGDEWEEVDSCWGFYGYEYAREAAEEALESARHQPEDDK